MSIDDQTTMLRKPCRDLIAQADVRKARPIRIPSKRMVRATKARLTTQKAACCYSGVSRCSYKVVHYLDKNTICFCIINEIRFTNYDSRRLLMDMMGRVGLVEIPVLIAPDQKVWMDRMIKEGKIAIPPGGTLEKGSLYSMFIRMLLHNAMEEQKRQEALEAADEDDE